MADQKKEPPTLLEDKLPPSFAPTAPPAQEPHMSYQQVAPVPQPHFPAPHFQQQIHQGVPPEMAVQQYPPDSFSQQPYAQGPPSIYSGQQDMNASYHAPPPSIPLPPPGSIHGAPKYEMSNSVNRNADDEWVVIDNNPPTYPTIQQTYPGFDPSQSQVLTPYPHSTQGGPVPAPSFSPYPQTSLATSSMSASYGAPAPQMAGGAPGSETVGFLYPTVHDPSHLADSQMMPTGPAPIFMVPGNQLHTQHISKNQFFPYAQHTHAVVTFAPFELSMEAANDIYVKWKEGLWFTPADFGSKSCEAGLRPVLMPYYLFDIALTTNYDGQVGFVETSITHHHHHHHHNGHHGHGNHTTASTTVRWRKARGSKMGQYSGVLAIGSVVEEDYERLNKIDGWRLESLVASTLLTDQLGPAVDWSHSFYRTGGALSMVERSEHGACASLMKGDNHADQVQGIKMSMIINSLNYRLAYMPVYYSVYTYEGKVYKIFINGQSGKIHGERPYGAGGLVNSLKAIGSLFKKKETPSVVSGSELVQKDNLTIYNPASYFILLPPSDAQLGVVSVGFITLENNGNAPIQLVSQKRGLQVQGGAFLLAPRTKKSFDFIGRWAIEVIGDPATLKITEFATKGGTKGNSLGMKV